MHINVPKNTLNGGKDSILETLLYIGCRYADGEKENDMIVHKVFEHIERKSTKRARFPTTDMVYWKKGAPSGLPGGMSFRGVRYLLQNGEARCGEWTSFFHDICIVQGVTGLYSFSVERQYIRDAAGNPTHYVLDADGFFNCMMLVKNWTIDPAVTSTNLTTLTAPVDGGASAQDLLNDPLNMFWDHVFSKYDDKYYDASYGIKSTVQFADNYTLLEAYCLHALTGFVYAIPNVAGQPIRDHLHSGEYADPKQSYTLIGSSIPANIYNYEYKIYQTSVQDHLDAWITQDA